jgi:hypothetical protein
VAFVPVWIIRKHCVTSGVVNAGSGDCFVSSEQPEGVRNIQYRPETK